MRPYICVALAMVLACSGAVDRTPPRQDVGLPLAPDLPKELSDKIPVNPLAIAALDLPVPQGCTVQDSVPKDRRVLDCPERFEPTMPKGWRRVGELPIWTSQGRSFAQSWARRGDRWWLTQSLHQSKGDHDSGASASGKASSSAPQ